MQKNHKTSLSIAILIILIIIIITFFMGNDKEKPASAVNAVPSDVSFILETNNFQKLLKKIKNNPNLYFNLLESVFLEKKLQEINFIDSLFENNKLAYKTLNEEKMIISGHIIEPGKMEYLFISKVNKKQHDKIKELLETLFKSKYKIKSSVYDNANIYNVVFPDNKEYNFYCSFHKNFFIFSFSQILTEKAIRRLNSDITLYANKNFNEIYNTSQRKGTASLFINYASLYDLFAEFFEDSFMNKLKLISNFAEWSAFDIDIKERELVMSGYTSVGYKSDYLEIFRNTTPVNSQMIKIFPKKTSSFVILNIGNGFNFKKRYNNYLSDNNDINIYRKKTSNFYKNFSLNENDNDIYELFHNEISIITEDINKNGMLHNKFAFLEITNIEKVKKYFDKIIEKNAVKNKLNTKGFKTLYTKFNKKYIINKLSDKKIPYVFFGTIFENINSEYYTFIEDYIVFGESRKAIKNLINSYEDNSTFIKKSQDAELINSLPDETNIFLYNNIFRNYRIISNYLKPIYKSKFKKEREFIFKLKGPVIQYIADSYPIYTNIKFAYNNKPTKISETIWECGLDTLSSCKPSILINHNTDEKEVFIQDKNNKIYLIDKNGNIIWSRQLSDKILSDVYQIDFYENNKLQIIFNTKKEIHVIDRNGNYLTNYPVNLKSTTSSGLAIFDYDNNKNYRILLPMDNLKVYLFDKTGKEIEGWTFGKTKNKVRSKIKYFRNNDTDYIVFYDDENIYFLNRKGQERIKPIINISPAKNSEIFFEKETNTSPPRFVTSNEAGTVYFIYLDGNVKKMIIKQYSNEHYFAYTDLNGDKINEFIYTDKQQTDVYNRKKERLFSYTFNEIINLKHSFYKFSADDIKIGVVSDTENKIYLINNDGTLYDGFPLMGSSLFSISRFAENENLSLIVGNSNSYIYKYKIKN